MKWLDLPPLNSLRAFSALAEAGGYSRAASRLNVTHAAVSQQVKALEAHLGVPLVLREGRGVRLTPEGEILARDLNAGFAMMSRGVDAVLGTAASRPVQITMSPAFAVEWLMPRITAFQQRHPEIILMLNPSIDVVELKAGGIDLAIRFTDRRRLKEAITPFMVSDMVVIGAPSLLGDEAFDDPADLMNLPWLQELGTNETADWFERRGVALNRPLMISQMPGNLIMEAVRRGDGITYTVGAYFEEEIKGGKMRVLYREPAFGIFYIATAPGVVRPAVKTFLDWLNRQIETASAGG